MKKIKYFFWTIFTGALLGGVLFAWFSPAFIDWYFTSPVDPLIVSCRPAMQWAIASYRSAILIGTGVGTATAGIIFLVFGIRSKKPDVSLDPAAGPKL